MQKCLLLAALLLPSLLLHAQPPTIQDCLGAIPICEPTYSSDVSLPGDGNYPNEINTAISCTSVEDHSVWYSFTVETAGDFGFVINPNNPIDDYDWALFNITNAECGDIYNDPSLLVSCNAAGGTFFDPNACSGATGATGDSNYDTQGAGCYSSNPNANQGASPFNDLIPVQAGNTYVLMVSNWSGSTFGYTIDFGLTSVGVFDFTPPAIDDFDFPEVCNDDTIEAFFSENIDCATIGVDNFSLVGPQGESYALTFNGGICDQGGDYEHDFSLTITPALSSPGGYTLQVISEEADPITDPCGNPLPPGIYTFSLTSDGPPEVDLGEDQFICDGQPVTLDVTTANADSYLWQDGSTDPVYMATTSGTYAVTLTNDCGEATDELTINLLPGPPEVALGNDTTLCPDETLLLAPTGTGVDYLWQNGSTNPDLEVSESGTYSVTLTNACGEDTDAINVDYTPALNVDIAPQVEACQGDTVVLDATNEQATYLWEDGSTDPARIIKIPGDYALTVTSSCEEVTTATTIDFLPSPSVELGADTILCPGDTLLLDATFPGADYTWQNGSTTPELTTSTPGLYQVLVSNICGEAEDSLRVNGAFPLAELTLGEDRYLCNGPVLFDVMRAGTDASYRWQDGTTLPEYVAERPGWYSVTVDNGCETLTDSVQLLACEFCEVYVPNAFSPNGDGRNDLFQPLTACDLLNFQFQVFDRWGGQVFYSNAPGQAWEGRRGTEKLSTGLYVWFLTYAVEVNGILETRETMGDVMLVR